MTCREFDAVVAELVRKPGAISSAEQSLDESVREAGERHAAECSVCADRLIAEERLTESLRVLSASISANAGAGEAVEVRWLEAFRARHTGSVVATAAVAALPKRATPKVIVFPAAGRSRMYWAGAIAAGIALIALLVSMRNGDSEKPVRAENGGGSVAVPSREAPLQEAQASRKLSTPEVIPYAARHSARRQVRAGQPREPEMVATEFVPLERGDVIEPMDRGQLVRVQVPRMAMRNAGFPVREERLNEPVLADVLVGEDGAARGIRFVKFTQ